MDTNTSPSPQGQDLPEDATPGNGTNDHVPTSLEELISAADASATAIEKQSEDSPVTENLANETVAEVSLPDSVSPAEPDIQNLELEGAPVAGKEIVPSLTLENSLATRLKSHLSKADVLKEKSAALFARLGKLWGKKEKVEAKAEQMDESGNVFTKMFAEDKKTTPEEILIQNIISQSRKKKEEEGKGLESSDAQKKILDLKNQQEAQKILNAEEERQKKAQDLLQISKIFAGATLLVPLMSFLLSSLFLSTEGFLSTLIRHKNYGLILEEKKEELDRTEEDLNQTTTTVTSFGKKIAEIQDNEVLGIIMKKRIAWREVFQEVSDLTNKTFEGNKVSHYVAFNNYSGDSDSMQLRISGEIRNPEGKTFESLITLKNALNSHEDFDGVSIPQFYKKPCDEKEKVISSEYCSPFFFTFEYSKGKEALKASSPETPALPK